MAALAGGGSLVVPLLAVVVVGTANGHEQGLKRRHREAGQLLKNSGASADLLEVHHAIASRSRRKEIAYSRYGLFPIKSDMLTAPRVGGGYFVGDYEGLTGVGNSFMP